MRKLEENQELKLMQPTATLEDGRAIYVCKSCRGDFPHLHRLLVREIAGKIASSQTLARVATRNSDSLWSIHSASCGSLIGCVLLLFLNDAGKDALLADALDTTNPPIDMICATGERPAAIYLWAVVARKMARISLMLVAQALSGSNYGGVPVYSRAATEGGLKALLKAGSSATGNAPSRVGMIFALPVTSSAHSQC